MDRTVIKSDLSSDIEQLEILLNKAILRDRDSDFIFRLKPDTEEVVQVKYCAQKLQLKWVDLTEETSESLVMTKDRIRQGAIDLHSLANWAENKSRDFDSKITAEKRAEASAIAKQILILSYRNLQRIGPSLSAELQHVCMPIYAMALGSRQFPGMTDHLDLCEITRTCQAMGQFIECMR